MSETEIPEWAATLPDDLKSSGIIRSTPDIVTAAKRLVDLERHRSSSMALPKDSDPESLSAFEKAVAKRGFIKGEVPESPEGYEAPEDDLITPEWKASKLKEFHEIGLTKTQAKAALERELAVMKGAREGLDQKDLDAVSRAMQRFNLDGSPKSLINALKEIGMTMTEDTTTTGTGAPSGLTLVEIDAKIAEINEKIMAFPEYDPRGTLLLDEKTALLLQRSSLRK